MFTPFMVVNWLVNGLYLRCLTSSLFVRSKDKNIEGGAF
ncbi:hypothetical protein B4107_2131 [Bacillus safensis]|nr:hypothetical protein B4107_2131 [Bacillus safensis]